MLSMVLRPRVLRVLRATNEDDLSLAELCEQMRRPYAETRQVAEDLVRIGMLDVYEGRLRTNMQLFITLLPYSNA